MSKYHIVKWSPEQPEKRLPATKTIYIDLSLAELVKMELEKVLPNRCFAIESVDEEPVKQHC